MAHTSLTPPCHPEAVWTWWQARVHAARGQQGRSGQRAQVTKTTQREDMLIAREPRYSQTPRGPYGGSQDNVSL
ncbi:hypothetical protein SKAU_G00154970 [Synaphobranchus kaupii]|uniref:Uncharacterized protein n=1 Tax=Synaphobranchus kaupii TaxID=118154 RepID=A0A9Q1FHD2_SYNKA|nr:hypothetical protein SKAU_G00154970 [Synaphobranchus kaupii]